MTDTRPRLAIVEDNQDLREELVFFLESVGYPVWGVASAEALWRKLHGSPVDIVLVDLGLPGEDGLGIVEYLHQLAGFGVIVVTARGDQTDKLRGLNLGADLYLVKPVNFARLARDVDALWHRMRTSAPAAPVAAPASASPQPWTLDTAAAALIAPGGGILKLTPQEYALIEILHRQPGEVHAKKQVHDLLFGHSNDPDTHRVDVILSRLRQKAAQQNFRLPIRTVFGRGLVFKSD